MAFRLDEVVVCGELHNTTKNSVRGWIRLKGLEHPLHLELTGNCDPDLAGWHVRFEVQGSCHVSSGGSLPETENGSVDLSILQSHQIGPTGTMTAARRVRAFDCSTDEFHRRCRLGEPPPTEWKPCLYLEWYSQNGRVMIELADPRIEYVARETLEGVPMCDRAGVLTDEAHSAPPTPTLDVTSLRFAEDELAEISEETYHVSDVDEEEEENESSEDPFDLFPNHLQKELDREAEALDYYLDHGEEEPAVLRETELLDDLIENSPGVPIRELLNRPNPLPLPDGLSDAEVETALKTVLMRMAHFGLAINICEHFSPRDTYRLLHEDFGAEECFFPELQGTGWVQGYGTGEYCHQCEAEFTKEYEEYERRLKEYPKNLYSDDLFHDDDDDDELPF